MPYFCAQYTHATPLGKPQQSDCIIFICVSTVRAISQEAKA